MGRDRHQAGLTDQMVVRRKLAGVKDSQEERKEDKQEVQQERDLSIVVKTLEEYQSEQGPILVVAALLLGGCAA